MSVRRNNKRAKIYLVFPGMGKTPLAERNQKYVDMDFGLYRESLGVSKNKEKQLYPKFAKFILETVARNPKSVILVNEPGLFPFLPIDVVFLPNKAKYSAQKLGVDIETASKWIMGWASTAKKNKRPITWLDIGLDAYLK